MSAFWIVSGGGIATTHWPTFEEALHDFLDRIVKDHAEEATLSWSS